MGAAIRKYKNLLSKVSQEMKGNYKISSLNLGQYVNEGDNVNVHVIFSDKIAKVSMTLMLKCPWNFKAVEDRGYLYLGIDLKEAKLVEDTLRSWRPTIFKKAFADEFFDKYYGRFNSDIANAIFNELQDRNNNPKYVITDKPSIKGNLDCLDCSPTYRAIDKQFRQFLSDYKFSIELRDGIHPTLSDRSMYPFIFIDLEDLKVIYLDGHYGRNSRQNRKICTLEYFMNHIKEICRGAIFESPIENLIEIKGSSPYIDTIVINTK